jgi:hypothetical protein
MNKECAKVAESGIDQPSFEVGRKAGIEAMLKLLTAAEDVLRNIEHRHQPPVHEPIPMGTMVRVGLHELANLRQVVESVREAFSAPTDHPFVKKGSGEPSTIKGND